MAASKTLTLFALIPGMAVITAGGHFAYNNLSRPAQAAQFDVVDDEETLCVLRFKKGFQISASRGGGAVASIWVTLNDVQDAPSGKELRLEVDTGSAKQTLTGAVADYSGSPEFEATPTLIGLLTDTASFTYRLEGWAPAVVKDHLTSKQVERFNACVSKGT